MKKTLIVLFAFLLGSTMAQAQEEGAKLAKQAGKALTSYNIDPVSNGAKLQEAKSKIVEALKQPDAQAQASAWITKGDIYNTLLQQDLARQMIDKSAPLTGDNDALEAFNGYQKGYDLTTKKYEKSDAVKGIGEVQGHLINIGVEKYKSGAYEKAFLSFEAALKSHETLTANGQKSLLSDKAQYDDQVYIAGVAAQLAKRNADALKYLEMLYKAGTDKPEVYEALYNGRSEAGDAAGAKKVLEEGRAKFPQDGPLLFAEINSYLKEGKLDDLVGRLQQAIQQEPNNVSLYVTLGNVFDNLYQRELQSKNDAKAGEYFESAKKYYEQAMAKDPKNADATYSLGALYYNKAAIRTQELNALPQDDFSAAGMKKYEKLKNEVMSLFDLGLPHFQKAESLNPNDMNTLIALKEIYARKDDDEKAIEFGKRLDLVRNGGKNEKSYFNQ